MYMYVCHVGRNFYNSSKKTFHLSVLLLNPLPHLVLYRRHSGVVKYKLQVSLRLYL